MDLIRTWNNTPISRRQADGYVNATAMAKANGKQWSHYRETDRATTYMEALSRNTEIRVNALYVSKPGEGTWIHPRLAIDFARWISPDFAVWMDGWFIESLTEQSHQHSTPQLNSVERAHSVLHLLKETTEFFERLGGLDERDQLLFKDLARNQALKVDGGALPALPGDEELTISDAWLEATRNVLPRTKAPAVGRLIAEMYREEHNAEPATRLQYVDGAPRQVKSYRRSWLLDAVRRLSSVTDF